MPVTTSTVDLPHLVGPGPPKCGTTAVSKKVDDRYMSVDNTLNCGDIVIYFYQ